MSEYSSFAEFYDELTDNVEYKRRAEYFKEILCENGITGGVLLDLACGTGTLSELMAEFGFDVIGADSSCEMLSVAQQKKTESEKDILYICQEMQELELYSDIDCCICALDSLNHITERSELQKAIDRVSLYLRPGGIFVFDVNTPYKHQSVLSGQTFVYDCDDVFCVWQNSECHDNIIDISLDFFRPEGESYYRESEDFSERAYTYEELCEILKKAGLTLLHRYAEDSRGEVKANTQREIYVTGK